MEAGEVRTSGWPPAPAAAPAAANIHPKVGNLEECVLVNDPDVVAGKSQAAQFRHRSEGVRVDDVYPVPV